MEPGELSPNARAMLDALRRRHTPDVAASARMRASIPGLAQPVAASGTGTTAATKLFVVVGGVVALVVGLWALLAEPSDDAAEITSDTLVVSSADLPVGAEDAGRAPKPEPPSSTVPVPAETLPAEESQRADAEPSPPEQIRQPKKPRRTRSPAAEPGVDPKAPEAAVDPNQLERELKLLARIRAARKRGQGDAALSLLEQHRREFPRSTFVEDRELLQIQVLCDLGRLDRAQRAIDRFQREHPGSALTKNVVEACPSSRSNP